MRTLRTYPGVLTMLILSLGFALNGLVDYINHEIAGPSFLAALTLIGAAAGLTVVYEGRALFQSYRRRTSSKVAKSRT